MTTPHLPGPPGADPHRPAPAGPWVREHYGFADLGGGAETAAGPHRPVAPRTAGRAALAGRRRARTAVVATAAGLSIVLGVGLAAAASSGGRTPGFPGAAADGHRQHDHHARR